MSNKSHLVKMHIKNLGCIGGEGLTVELDNIVCLVGANNAGKTTVLRAYELAVKQEKLSSDDLNNMAGDQSAIVELWVHIPENTSNIDEKWKEKTDDGLLLVRSKWEWSAENGYKAIRTTWDPEQQEYAENGKAAGLDTVFNSRLPKPFRIGSLDNPQEEQKQLLTLVLEPLVNKYKEVMSDGTSELSRKIQELSLLAKNPITELDDDIKKIQEQINSSYNKIFSTSQIHLDISLGDMSFDPAKALLANSKINISEADNLVRWDKQGTGSQRALFWSLLQVRSELNRVSEMKQQKDKISSELTKLEKKTNRNKRDNEKINGFKNLLSSFDNNENDIALPGYMLLIDEPETALHPSAVRAAKEHLYSLADEDGWQVMLSTHHPAFIDPLKEHTTIVRLQRKNGNSHPKIYRTDKIIFSSDELENLKALLLFDSHLAEIFFGDKIILVEGDTEFAAFHEVMNLNPNKYPIGNRPLIVRARGKAIITILVKILTHFKMDFAVLHDIDSPMTKSGERKNPAYAINKNISDAIKSSRESDLSVIYRCSCPNFEEHHQMDLPDKDKPFASWKQVRENFNICSSVEELLDVLINESNIDVTNEKDGCNYENILKAWVQRNNKQDEACYSFGE